MSQKEIAGQMIHVNEEGYMSDANEWTKEVAVAIAKEVDLELNDQHFAVLDFIRTKILNGDTLTIRSINKSGVVDTKTFYQLFPGAPLKKATMIAGVPKPSSCI